MFSFASLLRHEVCHCVQFHTNLGGDIGFLALYFAEYLSHFVRTWNAEQSYLSIEAEIEAYAMESSRKYFPKA